MICCVVLHPSTPQSGSFYPKRGSMRFMQVQSSASAAQQSPLKQLSRLG